MLKVKSLMLAEDWDPDKLVFPMLASPKIDGVRGANFDGVLRGRSLKTHANRYATEFFSHPAYLGFDGELVAAGLTDADLCRKTSSALSTIEGYPNIGFCVFDYYTEQTKHLPYEQRFVKMMERLGDLQKTMPDFCMWLKPVPVIFVENLEQLLHHENEWLEQGYEGVILRDPKGLYKEGRSTVKQRQILRIKRFIEEDALVLGIAEGETNTNDPLINERGLQYRQTNAEGMVPNGMVGSLTCELLKDVKDPVTKAVILNKGDIITVSPGKMTVAERENFFNSPHLILNKVIKFKFFPKGIKDKPRFPTYLTFRDAADMVNL